MFKPNLDFPNSLYVGCKGLPGFYNQEFILIYNPERIQISDFNKTLNTFCTIFRVVTCIEDNYPYTSNCFKESVCVWNIFLVKFSPP